MRFSKRGTELVVMRIFFYLRLNSCFRSLSTCLRLGAYLRLLVERNWRLDIVLLDVIRQIWMALRTNVFSFCLFRHKILMETAVVIVSVTLWRHRRGEREESRKLFLMNWTQQEHNGEFISRSRLRFAADFCFALNLPYTQDSH